MPETDDDIAQEDTATAPPPPVPRISDAEAAAVLVMLLVEEQAGRLLAQLEPDELKLLGEKMCELGDIGPEAIVQAVNDFAQRTEQLGINAHGRVGQVHSLMKRAVGEVKAENLMQRILPDEPGQSALELTRWLNPAAIVPLVRGEHPQAIAVLLIQLDPDVAAQVLHSLSPEEQSQVVHRVATMGPVDPGALAMLEELLTRRIAENHGQAALAMGGARNAADLINSSGKALEKRVLPEIAKKDKQLAKQIENEMFKFEHLFALDAQSMGSLLREVESDVLINALKGIAEEDRTVFFASMSSRAADGVKDEINARGRLKMADVVEAQRAIIATARRLAAEGVIAFGAGEDDYV